MLSLTLIKILFQDRTLLVECITGGALAFVGLFVEHVLPVHARQFRVDNPAIAYPFTVYSQVPAWLLFLLAVWIPGALVFLLAMEPGPSEAENSSSTVTASNQSHYRSRARHIAGFVLCIGVVAFITGVLKHAIGNERPDFLARCIPKKGLDVTRYYGLEVCTTTNIHRLHEGVRSTPSGHSSYSFGGLGYLTMMLLNRVRERSRSLRANPLAALASLLPVALASYIAISRVIDYRHHWYDIVFGTTIGAMTAVVSHKYHSPAPSAQYQEILQPATQLSDSIV